MHSFDYTTILVLNISNIDQRDFVSKVQAKHLISKSKRTSSNDNNNKAKGMTQFLFYVIIFC